MKTSYLRLNVSKISQFLPFVQLCVERELLQEGASLMMAEPDLMICVPAWCGQWRLQVESQHWFFLNLSIIKGG